MSQALASVLGTGAFSPIGIDARQTALFARAGKLVPRPVAFKDGRGERMGTARAMALGDDIVGVDRMLDLGARALREALIRAKLAADHKVPVLLALPEAGRLPEEEERRLDATPFLTELRERSQCPIDVAASRAVRFGSAGFVAVLEQAIARVADGPVVVGGIDSYHHASILKWLDTDKRVLGEVVHNGFIPSEGAAFLVLGPPKHDRRALAKIMHVASGLEQPKTATEPRTAELMTDLVRRASESTRWLPIPWVLCDVNGERHRSKEWSFTNIRNRGVLDLGHTKELRLYEDMGDLGAATGALYASHIVTAFEMRFAPAERALVCLASDGDARGVFALEATST